jgi:hypothetical protein
MALIAVPRLAAVPESAGMNPECALGDSHGTRTDEAEGTSTERFNSLTRQGSANTSVTTNTIAVS